MGSPWPGAVGAIGAGWGRKGVLGESARGPKPWLSPWAQARAHGMAFAHVMGIGMGSEQVSKTIKMDSRPNRFTN